MFFGWLSRLESNQNQENQNLLCSLYTTGQQATALQAL